jgi:HipA-like protein
MTHDFLYLIWKNPQNRSNYIVGTLKKEPDGYSFKYSNQHKEAKEMGWDEISSFPEDKEYKSKELFPAFASRLPDRKRKDIDKILNKYGLDTYDGYGLLKASGGRLPIDTYEFIDPIFDDDKTIEKKFYIMGIRHVCGCEGLDCGKRPNVFVSMKLKLECEPENKYDENAVKVLNDRGEYLGYIPRYYSEGTSRRLNSGMDYDCEVIEIDDDHNCQDCVKVRLRMPKQKRDGAK